MMLRPREDGDQRLMLQALTITPEPSEVTVTRDPYGNWIAYARFEAAADELCIHSELQVARAPGFRPAEAVEPAEETEARALAAIAPPAGPIDPEVAAWTAGFLDRTGAALPALEAMTRAVHAGFAYRRRLEHGVQPAAATLALRAGACRDFALLLVEAARSLGVQARFASGYVHCPQVEGASSRPGGGHTHAWACVLAPDGAWLDLDPTSGLVGPLGLVRVAVADDPAEASPIQGSYFGDAADFLGMEVEVDVHSEGAGGGSVAAGEPLPLRSVA